MLDPPVLLGGKSMQELRAYRLTTQTFGKEKQPRRRRLLLNGSLSISSTAHCFCEQNSSVQSLGVGLDSLQKSAQAAKGDQRTGCGVHKNFLITRPLQPRNEPGTGAVHRDLASRFKTFHTRRPTSPCFGLKKKSLV